ncbi:MAG: hypothetical protein ACE5Z5_03635 [Candidatus Bathyarchaeia archaeon]
MVDLLPRAEPVWSDVKCAYCGKTIRRGTYCIKVGIIRPRYYHEKCWLEHGSKK